MRSRLLSGTAELAKVFREWCGKADDIRIVTAWATTDCAVCDCLTKSRSKISTMVVGLDFYTTSPSSSIRFDPSSASARLSRAGPSIPSSTCSRMPANAAASWAARISLAAGLGITPN
jgi:hypothetical protein